MINKTKLTRKAFFKALYGDYFSAHKGYIETREIRNDGQVVRRFHENLEGVINYETESNLYFGIGPRETEGNGKKENIKYITTLWADVDFGAVGHKKKSKFADFEEAFQAVIAFPLKPSIIILSGHGLQVYWLLTEPIEVSNVSQIEGMLKGISKNIGGDTTSDLSRIFRVPCSNNLKDPENTKEVIMHSYNPDTRYSIGDFEFLISEDASIEEETQPFDDIDSLRVSQETKQLILAGKVDSDHYESRSEADFRVVCDLVEAGYLDKEILIIFQKYPIGEKFREQGGVYLLHTIKKARQNLRSSKRDKEDIRNLIDGGRISFNSTKVAECITEEHQLIYCAEEFYEYVDGCYRPISAEVVQAMVMDVIGETLTKRKMEEILCFIKVKAHIELVELNSSQYINLKNGLFDLKNQSIIPHDPKVYSTIQLPVDYNPKAECHKWFRTLEEILEDDKDKMWTLQEYFGLCLTKETKYEKALILVGEGANGKSVVLNILGDMLGRENYSAIPLEKFDNAHYISSLFGKLANISIETNAKSEVYDSTFKAIVSGDPITADPKFRKPFTFKPYSKLIFAVNNLPRVDDKTEAFFRRLLILRFNRVFGETEQNKNLKFELSQELDGIFIWALEGLERLKARGYFAISDNMQAETDEYKRENNNVVLFVEEKCTLKEEYYNCSISGIYKAYVDWCKENGCFPLAKIKFGKELKRRFNVKSKKGTDGEMTWLGICLD